MVFVILGTQKQDFSRLLKEIDKSSVLKNEEIIIQVGYTKYEMKRLNAKEIKFMSEEEMDEYISNANVIITHGGVGSIFKALLKGKKVLAVPRLARYHEHINDHQVEICKKLYEMNYLVYYNIIETEDEEFPETLDSKLNYLNTATITRYVEDKSYLTKIKRTIDTI